MKPCAIILAAGKGGRFGQKKQFVDLNKIPLFIYSVQNFSSMPCVLTVPAEDMRLAKSLIKKFKTQALAVDDIYRHTLKEKGIKPSDYREVKQSNG